MQVEVRYPVGTEVYVKAKVKSVSVREDGSLKYHVAPLDSSWDSMAVDVEALHGT